MAVATALFLVACEGPRPDAAGSQRVHLTTGMPGAGFHPLGAALAKAFERLLPAVDVQLHESSGSVEAIQAIQDGRADVGFALTDVTYLAYTGALEEDQRRFDRLRGIAVLELTALHFVVRAGANIHEVSDLRGRRVSIGPTGSGTALASTAVIRSYGLDPRSVFAEAMPWNEAAQRLVDGTLDAAFVNAAYPAESVTLALQGGASLAALEGPAIRQLRSDYPFFRPTFIPGRTYTGQFAPVRTVGVNNLLVCRADLSEDLVHELTAAFFESLPQLASTRLSLQTDLRQAPATPIPLHEGAVRYYREQELTR